MVKHYDEGKYLEDCWDTGKFRKLDTVLRDFLQLQQVNVPLSLTKLVYICKDSASDYPIVIRENHIHFYLQCIPTL